LFFYFLKKFPPNLLREGTQLPRNLSVTESGKPNESCRVCIAHAAMVTREISPPPALMLVI
jgi:hypothetical protein